MNPNLFLILLAVGMQAHSIPINDWEISLRDDAPSPSEGNNSTASEAAQELGVSDKFLQELKVNWDKALEVEKAKESRLRQEGFGGGGNIGDFFGVGGNNGANNNNNNGPDDEEEEDGEEVSTTEGPGAAGILTGLFGIFSGLGTLNPKRVIQSTVNFFPPDRRVLAQMALDNAFGIHNVTTLAPLTDAPPRKTSGRPTNRLNSTTATKLTMTTPLPKVEVTTKKKLILKETSLLEDFEEAADKLVPLVSDKGTVAESGKPQLSTLEKDFADTAEKFKIGSLLDADDEKPKDKEDPIIKAFAETVLKF